MVVAGRVSGLFGAKGGVSLVLFDTFPHDFDMEEPVFVVIDEHTVPLFFDHFARRGRKGATASFADIDTEQRATELVGLSFSIRSRNTTGLLCDKSAMENAGDELRLENLIGWKAEFDNGREGLITDYFESDYNPLLEVEIEEEIVLIPVVSDFFQEIDEKTRKIVFSLPEGLLELNPNQT